mmetsp:Transcript_25030/g.87267  ORF Transcript_25030/g.87267 Transcript_25030/m.87267 type:complete len:215 (+) Transcript_25030:2265-2909(+)
MSRCACLRIVDFGSQTGHVCACAVGSLLSRLRSLLRRLQRIICLTELSLEHLGPALCGVRLLRRTAHALTGLGTGARRRGDGICEAAFELLGPGLRIAGVVLCCRRCFLRRRQLVLQPRHPLTSLLRTGFRLLCCRFRLFNAALESRSRRFAARDLRPQTLDCCVGRPPRLARLLEGAIRPRGTLSRSSQLLTCRGRRRLHLQQLGTHPLDLGL